MLTRVPKDFGNELGWTPSLSGGCFWDHPLRQEHARRSGCTIRGMWGRCLRTCTKTRTKPVLWRVRSRGCHTRHRTLGISPSFWELLRLKSTGKRMLRGNHGWCIHQMLRHHHFFRWLRALHRLSTSCDHPHVGHLFFEAVSCKCAVRRQWEPDDSVAASPERLRLFGEVFSAQ